MEFSAGQQVRDPVREFETGSGVVAGFGAVCSFFNGLM